MEENPENDRKETSKEDLEEKDLLKAADPESETIFIDEFEEIQKTEVELHDNFEKDLSETAILDDQSLKKQVRMVHRNLIEAALYAAGRPLDIEEISTKLELPKKEVESLVNEVAFNYLERNTALVIAQIGDRYQMQIKPEYTEKVSKFAKGGAIAERYLRTLTIIALKQPILKSMVIKIRGTGAYEHVKYLIDNGFINAIKKGRSHELTTTDKYSDMFGLPKDKTELKRAMITQLGLDEVSGSESQVGADEELTIEPEIDIEEELINEMNIESENEKDEL